MQRRRSTVPMLCLKLLLQIWLLNQIMAVALLSAGCSQSPRRSSSRLRALPCRRPSLRRLRASCKRLRLPSWVSLSWHWLLLLHGRARSSTTAVRNRYSTSSPRPWCSTRAMSANLRPRCAPSALSSALDATPVPCTPPSSSPSRPMCPSASRPCKTSKRQQHYSGCQTRRSANSSRPPPTTSPASPLCWAS